MKKPKEIKIGDRVTVTWLDTCVYYESGGKANEILDSEKADTIETKETGYFAGEKNGKIAIAMTKIPNYYRKENEDMYKYIVVIYEGAITHWEKLKEQKDEKSINE